MAQIIKAGSNQPESIVPENGTEFSLRELQNAVGGYIEVVHLADGRIMVVNEDGKVQGLPFNMAATQILSDIGTPVYGRVLKGDDAIHSLGCIVGDALICESTEIN